MVSINSALCILLLLGLSKSSGQFPFLEVLHEDISRTEEFPETPEVHGALNAREREEEALEGLEALGAPLHHEVHESNDFDTNMLNDNFFKGHHDVKVEIIPHKFIIARPGQRVQLKCQTSQAGPSVSVKWTGSDRKTLPFGIVDKKGVLRIPKALPEYSGEYLCVVSFNGEIRTESAFVLIPGSEQCQNSWISFNSSCYLPIKSQVTWTVAQRHCRTLHGRIVDVHSKSEQKLLDSLIGQKYWIGLRDSNGKGLWKWNITDSPFVINRNLKQKPRKDETCTVFEVKDKSQRRAVVDFLKPHTCNDRLPFLCRKKSTQHGCTNGFEGTGNICLKLVEQTKNHDAARTTCDKLDASLFYAADMNTFSDEEKTYIKNLLTKEQKEESSSSSDRSDDKADQYWTGIYFNQKQQKWGFDDIELKTPDFLHWGPNQPGKKTQSGSNCVVAFPKSSGEWNVMSCNEKFGFVCKKNMERQNLNLDDESEQTWKDLENALVDKNDDMNDDLLSTKKINKKDDEEEEEDSTSSTSSEDGMDDDEQKDESSSSSSSSEDSSEDKRRRRKAMNKYFSWLLASWGGLTTIGIALIIVMLGIIVITSALVSRRTRRTNQRLILGSSAKVPYVRVENPNYDPTDI